MHTALWTLVTLATVVSAEHWIFGGVRPIVTTRLDPVISPNAIGSHVHSIVGASRFQNVYDPADLVQSNCTTIPVQPDKSNYWAPQLYHQDQNTSLFTPIPTSFNIYYLMRPGPMNESIKAFPPGLRMVAGDPNRRSYNASDFAQQAISFVCLDFNADHSNDPDWDERPNFFDHNCPDGMRAQVFFPSCWDGVNLDSPDHTSHMAYPIQNYNGGDCPDSHPVHLVSLFYEMFVSVDQFDFWGNGTWVLANGDTTGYGHHGDFTNGWDVDLLQNAIDNCPNATGNVMDCPPLAAAMDQASADACVLETEIVDEDTGFETPLSALPGCNPLWNGTGLRTECLSDAELPQLIPAQTPLPTNWSEIGCIAEGTNGRALIGASTTSPNLTRAACVAFCESKGFALAGVEFSDECYCDDKLRNGATNTTLIWNECTNHCAGNDNEICGGPARLTLLVTSNPPPPPNDTILPDGWSFAGCVSDDPARALTGFSTADDQMTHASCVATCSSHNFTIAGIEFGRECYCGNAFENGAGQALDPASCNVVCAGDALSTCGGSWALSAFQSNATVALQSSASSAAPSTSASLAVSVSTTASQVPSVPISSASPASPVSFSATSTPVSSASSVAGSATPSISASTSQSIATSVPASSSAPSNTTVVLPDGWASIGCRQDDVSGRTLDMDAFTSDNMTIPGCIAHCASLGHPVAGVEYARECYCGSAFVNDGGAVLPDDACDMACSGDTTSICGGPGALSAFQDVNTTAVARRMYRPRGSYKL
ncbi:WSC-domain-containing protein [Dichomitus squalens]|uniref:WSC-domain-containing protein n=1 Tax=Dichomitus squalens TaxID=114155 RepID=A0A4Q9Q196_9APHY|nr:WSC-domain-containing protein [Dichomitus squalens]TBU60825.1 WSC-domain-containing protein [Dichomitus squalens]